MRHSMHFVIGSSEVFDNTSLELKKYLYNYGSSELSEYFRTFLLCDKDKRVEVYEAVSNSALADVCELGKCESVNYNKVLDTPQKEKEERFGQFITSLRDSSINMEHPGDYKELHICFYVPLYDKKAVSVLLEFISIIKSEKLLSQIDVVGLSYDLYPILCNENELNDYPLKRKDLEKNCKRSTNDILSYKKKNSQSIDHFIFLQNVQNDGISLNLNNTSFNRIIAEFAQICIERYKDIFGVLTEPDKIQCIGFSALSLDKFYFIEYLLSKTYIYKLKQEGIDQTAVPINKSMQCANEILRKWVKFLSDFYENDLKNSFDQKDDENDAEIKFSIQFEDKLRELKSDVDEYLQNSQFSLVEKKAILAAMLGFDDESFEDDIFDATLYDVRDLECESIQLFVDANNEILKNTEDSNQSVLPVIVPDNSEDSNPIAINPIDRIKQLRIRMRQHITYIRKLESENEKLSNQISGIENSTKCIENGVYKFGGTEYKLLNPTLDTPLTEQYIPKEVSFANNIDLSSQFTQVKNQSTIGSCLSFSLVSVFEYFLKQNNLPNPDLSELFLYYNSRKRDGKENEDSGSCIKCAVESLQQDGLCAENVWGYNVDNFNITPSEEAYNDAKKRYVRKALNVSCKISDIKSALTEGFPVIISVNIFDSFANTRSGFVSLPSKEELEESKDEYNGHAMVVCGYSDDQKVLKVRNSWGEDFGDKGYCYLPYSYIENPELCHYAAIITEIEFVNEENVVNGIENNTYSIKEVSHKQLKFNIADANVQYAINSNLISEEQVSLNTLKDDDLILQRYYTELRQILKNQVKRDSLRDAYSKIVEQDINKLSKQLDDKSEERLDAIKKFAKVTLKNCLKVGTVVLALLVVSILLLKLSGFLECDNYTSWNASICDWLDKMQNTLHTVFWVLTFIEILLCIFLSIYIPYRLTLKRRLSDDYIDQMEGIERIINSKKTELKEIKLKYHFAGKWLCLLFDFNDALQNKYNVFVSFNNNLKQWYSEQLEYNSKMNSQSQPPFESILDNNTLDAYFENEKNQIVEGKSLASFMNGFELSEDGIVKFKEDLRKYFIQLLHSKLSDFSMYKYLSGHKYSYLKPCEQTLKNQLAIIDIKSKLFAQCDDGCGAIDPQKCIFIYTDNSKDEMNWNETYPKAFSARPTSYKIDSPYKIVLFQFVDLDPKQCVILK